MSEPSVVALRTQGSSAQESGCSGRKLKMMLGRTPGNIEAIRPMRDGVIADFHVTEKMLQYFIHKVHDLDFKAESACFKVCVPCSATQVERRAIKESAEGRCSSNCI